jgi:ABC-type amino acid transport substrate-binding protein
MRLFGRNCVNRILRWYRRGGPALVACAAFLWAVPGIAAETLIRYFPSGAIYEYRWKLLDLALAHTRESGESLRMIPYDEDTTQNRAVSLLQSGAIDVIALGTNEERESKILPIKIDILRGIVGFRVFLIRSADQERISQMDDVSLRKQLTLGLNSQWADLAVMRANGFSVTTSSGYEALFDMLAAGRFDAFPRGLNEAQRELDERRQHYPQLALEKTRAVYFPFPVYFWVRKDNQALAQRIERGLKLSLADGSFRKTFEQYHAAEIATMRQEKRHVLRLTSPILPSGTPQPDTSWWWHNGVVPP